MDLGLQGKKAIVTGGTKGIGLAIAETLAGEGCDIAVCARDAALVDVPFDGATVGEIIMRGNVVMKGYLKNAPATARL